MQNASSRVLALVLGSGRSGTSLVARMFVEMGFATAGALVPPNDFNPDGYFEPTEVVAVNQSVYQLFARPVSAPLPAGWEEDEAVLPMAETAREYLERGFAEHGGLLVLKDPRISCLLPLWRKAAAEVGASIHCFLTLRNPANVIGSMVRAGVSSPEEAESMWLIRNVAALGLSGGSVTLIDYDRLLEHPEQVIDGLIEVCRGLGAPHVGRDKVLACVRPDAPASTPLLYEPTARTQALHRLIAGCGDLEPNQCPELMARVAEMGAEIGLLAGVVNRTVDLRLKQQDSALARTQTKLKVKVRELAAAREMVVAAERETRRAKKRTAELAARVAELEGQAAQRQVECEALQVRNAELDAALVQKNAELETAIAAARDIEAELKAALATEIEQSATRIGALKLEMELRGSALSARIALFEEDARTWAETVERLGAGPLERRAPLIPFVFQRILRG